MQNNYADGGFARVDEVKAGSRLITDAGFACMDEGELHLVHEDAGGLWIGCEDGQHYLDGQLDDEGQHYVGLYLAKGG